MREGLGAARALQEYELPCPTASPKNRRPSVHSTATSESYESCLAVLRDLVKRGLQTPVTIPTDGAPGLIKEEENDAEQRSSQEELVTSDSFLHSFQEQVAASFDSIPLT